MLTVAFVLFVLSRYHSPPLAGIATFLLIAPGLFLSPIAGALLDRYSRVRLISADYAVVAVTLFTIAGLSVEGALAPPVLLAICAAASITGPLSVAGARAIFPIIVPDELWERANAVDNVAHVLATIVGAPVAGMLVALAGPESALVVTAVLFLVAGVALFGVHDPGLRQRGGRVFAEAWEGLVFVLRNRTLNGLALTFLFYGIAWGCLVIAIPVVVLDRFHQGPAVVGYIWGAVGAAGFVATLFVGRLRTLGRERQLMVGSILAMAAALSIIPLAPSVAVVALALVVFAVVETPFDISFLTLRQRRTDPARFGRVFAVSVSLNMVGGPIGSAVAGPLIGWSLNAALWIAVAFTAAAALFPMLVIPARDEGAHAN